MDIATIAKDNDISSHLKRASFKNLITPQNITEKHNKFKISFKFVTDHNKREGEKALKK